MFVAAPTGGDQRERPRGRRGQVEVAGDCVRRSFLSMLDWLLRPEPRLLRAHEADRREHDDQEHH
jgi:hypothetical protein